MTTTSRPCHTSPPKLSSFSWNQNLQNELRPSSCAAYAHRQVIVAQCPDAQQTWQQRCTTPRRTAYVHPTQRRSKSHALRREAFCPDGPLGCLRQIFDYFLPLSRRVELEAPSLASTLASLSSSCQASSFRCIEFHGSPVNTLAEVLNPWRRCSCYSRSSQPVSASPFVLSTLAPYRSDFIGKLVAPLPIAGAREFATSRITEFANSIWRGIL